MGDRQCEGNDRLQPPGMQIQDQIVYEVGWQDCRSGIVMCFCFIPTILNNAMFMSNVILSGTFRSLSSTTDKVHNMDLCLRLLF